MNTVRLEPALKAKIQNLAQLQGISQSELQRRALELYCEQNTVKQSRFEDMFGIAEGDEDLSARVSQEFGQVLAEKHG